MNESPGLRVGVVGGGALSAILAVEKAVVIDPSRPIREAASIDRASLTLPVRGFSTRTCLPASIAARASVLCLPGGVAVTTASTSSKASGSIVQALTFGKVRVGASSLGPVWC